MTGEIVPIQNVHTDKKKQTLVLFKIFITKAY